MFREAGKSMKARELGNVLKGWLLQSRVAVEKVHQQNVFSAASMPCRVFFFPFR